MFHYTVDVLRYKRPLPLGPVQVPQARCIKDVERGSSEARHVSDRLSRLTTRIMIRVSDRLIHWAAFHSNPSYFFLLCSVSRATSHCLSPVWSSWDHVGCACVYCTSPKMPKMSLNWTAGLYSTVSGSADLCDRAWRKRTCPNLGSISHTPDPGRWRAASAS